MWSRRAPGALLGIGARLDDEALADCSFRKRRSRLSARDLEIAGLTADSRKVKPGFLFAALQGVAAHGRDFVAQAKANGAVAVLSAGDLGADPGIAACRRRQSAPRLRAGGVAFYPRRPQTIVAVTGTNGKSSTVDFLRQIWAHAGKRAASLGTLGAIWADRRHRSRPHHRRSGRRARDAARARRRRRDARGDGSVEPRASSSIASTACSFAAGAFTNLTQDHLDYHDDMDAYRDAKLQLWALVKPAAPP